MSRSKAISGASWCLLGVALGAFGAHALKSTLTANATIDVWKTAVSYQMWHALALLLIGTSARPSALQNITAILLNLGILLFSGSLYWLALGGPTWLGPITPIGGTCFIAAWACFIISRLREPKE